MQLRILLILAAFLVLSYGVGFVLWFVLSSLQAISKGSRKLIKDSISSFEAHRTRRVEREKQAAILAHQKQIDDFRSQHPVQIVGVPDLALLKQIADLLDDFISSVKSHRPQISPYDNRFRSTSFSYPFDFFFKRKNNGDDGPDPEPLIVTLDSLAIQGGRPLEPIYKGLAAASEFPVREPAIGLDDLAHLMHADA